MNSLNYSFSEFLYRKVEGLLISDSELEDKLNILSEKFKNKEL